MSTLLYDKIDKFILYDDSLNELFALHQALYLIVGAGGVDN